MSAQTRVRYTGFPPPAQQIAGQVRSPTGATYCARQSAQGPTTPMVRVALASVGASTSPADTNAGGKVNPLLALLRRLDAHKSPIPYPADIAEILNVNEGRFVVQQLEALERRRLFTLWRHHTNGRPTEYVVRLAGSDHQMRTPGAGSMESGDQP